MVDRNLHNYQAVEVKRAVYELLIAMPRSRVHDCIILLVLGQDHGISFGEAANLFANKE